ncbi:histidinol-phosphatase (PHP family) [Desulfohalotomaculum tongense]|nr:histidinol-phosphatase HisJ family protein [Desulforadius tongensis]MBM7855929.1 histidinol-phosphatase (PHP family) [Desulforadius tongensis]
MLVDYHWHTARCGHASGTMQQYVDAGRRLGLTEVGFADHIPMYWLPPDERDPEAAMKQEELEDYIKDVHYLQRANPGISIRLGLEVDYIPGHETTAKKILSSLPLDYVLGSVHYLEGWGFDNPDYIHRYKDWDLYELYRRYFDTVCDAAASGLFDIMAHTDLIKKFGYRPRGNLAPLFQKVARTFAESGVCVEVNTAGLRAAAREMYPAAELLKMLHKHGVPVTMGSDAHKPQQVGQGLKSALQLIKAVGYDKIVTFKNKKRRYLRI